MCIRDRVAVVVAVDVEIVTDMAAATAAVVVDKVEAVEEEEEAGTEASGNEAPRRLRKRRSRPPILRTLYQFSNAGAASLSGTSSRPATRM